MSPSPSQPASKSPRLDLSNSHRDSSTRVLIEACLAGDEIAWNTLVDRYEGLVWSVALEVGLDSEDAGDAFQYVWLELHRSLLRIRDYETLPRWLIVATRRQAYKIAARRRRHLVPLGEVGGPALLDPEQLADERVVAMENRRRLEAAMAELPAHEAELLRLLFLDPSEPSYREISEKTGLAVGSIGPMRARYLEKLRKHLEASS